MLITRVESHCIETFARGRALGPGFKAPRNCGLYVCFAFRSRRVVVVVVAAAVAAVVEGRNPQRDDIFERGRRRAPAFAFPPFGPSARAFLAPARDVFAFPSLGGQACCVVEGPRCNFEKPISIPLSLFSVDTHSQSGIPNLLFFFFGSLYSRGGIERKKNMCAASWSCTGPCRIQ